MVLLPSVRPSVLETFGQIYIYMKFGIDGIAAFNVRSYRPSLISALNEAETEIYRITFKRLST